MKDDFFRRRIIDLAEQADRTGRFTFTDFLTEAEYGEYLAVREQLPRCGCTVWGGHENADRVMLRFGSAEQLGYEEPFPIVCVAVQPVQEKFAEQLSHRDVLGAVMHLGIERGQTGDILTEGKAAYLFCTPAMGDYICREMTRVKHTTVCCTVTDTLPEAAETHYETVTVQAASSRIDGLIAKLYHMSRGECLALFRAGKVALGGAVTENSSAQLKPGDVVSVRGCGKFRYAGVTGTTRKGNQIIALERFV
ncbi:MAG: hypothetical protein IKX57_01690 [Oscillospiraceae bacterium]|nr:hypothetical protein [Oscillospiraceae bacterium]MBR5722311.1 hypothetical protein [Oscillospiraceae bacterium]